MYGPSVHGLLSELAERSGLAALDTLEAAARAVSLIPYGRPAELSARGVLDSWRGTCSTKHLLLLEIAGATWPDLRPQLWHRTYRVTSEAADARWGRVVAATVPAAGLVDVHTYLTVECDHGSIVVDVTFPIGAWDGRSSLPLACGPGTDEPAGPDPLASKARLVATHCDPAVREPFIAALSGAREH